MLVYRRVPHFYTLKYLGSEMVDPLWLIPKGLTPPVVEGIHFFLFSKFLFSYIFTYVDSFFLPPKHQPKKPGKYTHPYRSYAFFGGIWEILGPS